MKFQREIQLQFQIKIVSEIILNSIKIVRRENPRLPRTVPR